MPGVENVDNKFVKKIRFAAPHWKIFKVFYVFLLFGLIFVVLVISRISFAELGKDKYHGDSSASFSTNTTVEEEAQSSEFVTLFIVGALPQFIFFVLNTLLWIHREAGRSHPSLTHTSKMLIWGLVKIHLFFFPTFSKIDNLLLRNLWMDLFKEWASLCTYFMQSQSCRQWE